jgi:hypothetical protein
MKKFETIIDNMINGNVRDAKTGFKKLSKVERRQLVDYCTDYAPNEKQTFFNLL